MELVKRLEGSEPEEVDYDFEEHYLQQDQVTTKRKKNTLFTIVGLIFIGSLGYFGFKNFDINEIKPIDKSLIVTSFSPEDISKTPKIEVSPMPVKKQEPKEIEKKILVQSKNIKVTKIQEEIKPILPIKEEAPKIVTYTEVLAQKLEPRPRVTKKVASEPVLKEIKIVKKTIPKKKVLKRIVTKKAKPQKVSNKKRIAIVKKGDTLALISKRFYGSTKEFQKIIRANKSIKSHKTSLKIGQRIIIPSLNTKQNKIISSKKVSPQKITSKKTRVITVRKGDTLNVIAQRFYGNANEYKRIIRANKSIKSHKTRLKLGQKVIVPFMPKNKRRRFVTVKKGYSLAYISKKFYGNIKEVKKIVNANYSIKNSKSTLRIGQKVYVPR